MKIRKLLSPVLALCMLLSVMPMTGITASAEELWADGDTPAANQIFYTAATKIRNISSMRAVFGDITSTYDEATHKGILTFASDITYTTDDMLSDNDDLTGIILPSSVKSIGDGAFYDSDSLESVSMPGVTDIKDNAFNDCDVLTTVYMPEVTSIGEDALAECASLISISMPKVETIGGGSFFSCASLTTVTMPKITAIEQYVFSNSSLTYAYAPAEIASALAELSLYSVATEAANGTVAIAEMEDAADCIAYCKSGTALTVTAAPNDGYELDKVYYNDGTQYEITPVSGVYAFTMPAKAVTVTATFKKVPHTHDGVTYDTELTHDFVVSLVQDTSNCGYVLPAGNYYLSGDLTLDSGRERLYIRGNSVVKICLNGHTLKGNILTADTADLTVCSCADGGKIYSDAPYTPCIGSGDAPTGTFDAFTGKTTIKNIEMEAPNNSSVYAKDGTLIIENCIFKNSNTYNPAIHTLSKASAMIKDTEITGNQCGITIGSDSMVTLKNVNMHDNTEYDITAYGNDMTRTTTTLTLDGTVIADKIIMNDRYTALTLGEDFSAKEIGIEINEEYISVPYALCDTYNSCFKCTQLPYHITDVNGKAVFNYRIDSQPEEANGYILTLDKDGASTSAELTDDDVTYQWYKVSEKKLCDYEEDIEVIGLYDLFEMEEPESGKCYVIANTVNTVTNGITTETLEEDGDYSQDFGFAFKNDGTAPMTATFTSDVDLTDFMDVEGNPLVQADGEYTVSFLELEETQWVVCYCGAEGETAYDIENISFTLSSPVTGQTTNQLIEYENGESYLCAATLTDDSEIKSDTVTIPPAEVANAGYSASLTLNKNIDINFKMSNLGTDGKGAGFDKSKLTITVDGENWTNYTVSNGTLSGVLKAVEPKDIGTDLHIVITYNGVTVKDFNYSVKSYCEAAFNAYAQNNEKYGKLNTLCESLLNYGKYAEDYDKGTNESTLNDGHAKDFTNYTVTQDTPAPILGDYAEEASASLNLGSTVKLNYVLTGCTVALDNTTEDSQNFYVLNQKGEQITPSRVDVSGSDGNYTVSIDLYATQLANTYTLVLKGVSESKFAVTYGVYHYCAAVIEGDYSETVQTLCKAIHNYSEAVQAYIAR